MGLMNGVLWGLTVLPLLANIIFILDIQLTYIKHNYPQAP